MAFSKYYQEELLALRELGKEFAAKNPALVPFLDTPGRDPDVERLLEGFAFLTGRLRQKIDDELPEIIQSLFNMLWPNYLRPIPAASILRYKPSGNISGSVTITKGTMVDSKTVNEFRCQFKTVYDVEILPLKLVEHNVLEKDNEASLVLKFKSLGAPLINISFSNLRFFIHGEPSTAKSIYYSMVAKTQQVRLVLQDKNDTPVTALSLGAKECIRPVGFSEEEGLYPYPANIFHGYRILQEYFSFPEKFLFVDVVNLDKGFNSYTLSEFNHTDEFELHFVLPDLPDSFRSFRLENWQLFCTPVVNLFKKNASPLLLDHKQTEYHIVPDKTLPYNYATYSIDRMIEWGHNKRIDKIYTEFVSAEYETAKATSHSHYRRKISPSLIDGIPEIYISLLQEPEQTNFQQSKSISIELTCTNRNLPQQLDVGDICIPADNTPHAVSFQNITPVTPPLYPPLEGDILWRLMSNMSLNYISLTSIPALRSIISAYDLKALHDRKRAKILKSILNGMISISCKQTDRLHKGLPMRGMRTTLVLDQHSFSCEGDMYLFGSVLSEFFALYATANSFHQLTVVEAKRGVEYQWPSILGKMRM